jgi:hypothetical protein
MKGWELTGKELLGMCTVDDVDCPLFGTVPAPRVLQNQLDRSLESYIAVTEKKLLKAVQRELRRRSSGRETIFAAVLCILNVLERDTWRLMYWRKRREQV